VVEVFAEVFGFEALRTERTHRTERIITVSNFLPTFQDEVISLDFFAPEALVIERESRRGKLGARWLAFSDHGWSLGDRRDAGGDRAR